jgi:Catalase/Transaldolase/Fructose-6-phosphate aldolase
LWLHHPDTDHPLKAADRGTTVLEDFHLREKITHFGQERIPERVVGARGAPGHGIFESNGTAGSVTRRGSWPRWAGRPGFSPGSPPCSARAARRTPCRFPRVRGEVLSAQGVAVWLDDLPRELVATGRLQELVNTRHVVGVTTNPTIFAAVLAHGDRYDDQLHDLAESGLMRTLRCSPRPPTTSGPAATSSLRCTSGLRDWTAACRSRLIPG